MKNRAKCKLCQDIIESFHASDLVVCKCTHIYVDGGEAMKCGASDWSNFLRVDDEGNEIIVTIKEKEDSYVKPLYNENELPPKESVKKEIDIMLENINRLPEHALMTPLNHYDLMSLLLLFKGFLRD